MLHCFLCAGTGIALMTNDTKCGFGVFPFVKRQFESWKKKMRKGFWWNRSWMHGFSWVGLGSISGSGSGCGNFLFGWPNLEVNAVSGLSSTRNRLSALAGSAATFLIGFTAFRTSSVHNICPAFTGSASAWRTHFRLLLSPNINLGISILLFKNKLKEKLPLFFGNTKFTPFFNPGFPGILKIKRGEMTMVGLDPIQKCTLIETIQGEVKLIKRADANLTTLEFSNLRDCLDYVSKYRFQINIVHSGRKKDIQRWFGARSLGPAVPENVMGRPYPGCSIAKVSARLFPFLFIRSLTKIWFNRTWFE